MAPIPLAQILRYHAERIPGGVAVRQDARSVTWAELDARANRRARLLAANGVRAGDFVTLMLPNCVEYFENTYAIWKLGAIPSPVSAKLPAAELAAIVDLVRPKLIVGSPTQAVGMGITAIAGDCDASAYSASPGEEPVAPYWKAMTSGGSTGRPKIIVDHTPAVFDPLIPARRQPPGGVMLSPGPLYHNAPFIATHTALSIGCQVVSMTRFDAEEALRLIEAWRVQWVSLVPTMMKRIWDLPRDVRESYDVSSLRTVWHMAAPTARWLKEAWIEWLGSEKLWELYGGTERLAYTIINGTEWLQHPGSVGRVDGAGGLKILDEHGVECAAGEIGEIYLRPPPGAAPTYHYIGAESKRRPGGWESIGDMGYVDADGYLYLADRRVDLILRGGANIYPAEIEAALDQHPDVAASVVVGLPDDDLGAKVHAIVEIRPGAPAPDASGLAAFLAERMAPYKLPESFELAASPLRDEAGKVRRTSLRQERLQWAVEGRRFATALPRLQKSTPQTAKGH